MTRDEKMQWSPAPRFTAGWLPSAMRDSAAIGAGRRGAPPAPPLPEVKLIWDRDRTTVWWRYALTALIAAMAGAAAALQLG